MNKTINELLRTVPLYFKSKYESDFLVRSEPPATFFIKPKGGPESIAEEPNNLVTDFILEKDLISKEEYEAF